MIVFHIPSWYPYPQVPYSGIFIKELIEAYAAIYTDDLCFVSNFHQLQFDIQLRKPLQTTKQLLHYLSLKSTKEIKHSDNLIEFQSKLLAGSTAIFGLRINSQLAIAEKHLKLLIKRKTKPHLIHAHVCYPAGVIAKKLSEKFNIPYVISEQSGTNLFQRAFEKYDLKDVIMDAFSHAKKVSALSTFHKIELQKLNLDNISIIPNPVDETMFKPGSKTNNNVFNFFALSWVVETKGIRELVLAVEKVVRRNYKIKVKIGGAGKQLEEYKNLSVSLGIDSFIEWSGPLSRSQVCESHQQCDCFILPSHSESLGVVYIEATACGKPVIATDCGGPADIINTSNGLLVEVGDVDAIANAMIYMIEHSKDYSSEIIRKDFLQRFSRQPVVEKIKRFYNEAIND